MDFDEYEYLEKAVETKSNGVDSHGRGSGEKERERDRERRSSDSKRRAGDDERDRDRSKRSKSEDKEHREHREHRDRDRERGEKDRERERGDRDKDRHHREHRERDKEKERDREKVKEKDKEREKDRDSEKDRVREKDKEREKGRDKDRDREKEKEKERERRSKSRHREEEREKERERERHRERSKDRDYRDRRKKEETEPEADPERDQRTVFAYQLSLRADERDVYEFFSKAGKVRDVRLIMDRNSRRSKGVGYIEFYDVMSVPMAIALSGQLLMGQPVMVKPSEAEKNMVQTTAAIGVSASGGGRKIYVGNLHTNINEEQLRQVFEPFGPVELVQLPMDPMTGLCKGFGFLQFAKIEDAKAAQSLNGQLDIAGRTIKVSLVTDQPPAQTGPPTAGDLDDDEGGGLSLNASSRALLMAKLDRTGTASSFTSGIVGSAVSTGAVPIPGVLGAHPVLQNPIPALSGNSNPGLLPNPAVPVPPTECLLLNNMFDPSIEAEPDFDLDIKEDVQEECSKFGVVKHIFVDKNTAGFVYLKFDSITSAMNAQKALHGRWFAGKMITATYMTTQQYEAKFPGQS